MGNVALAKLAEVFSISVNHGAGVIVNAGAFDFIDRHDDHQPQPFGGFTHELRSGATRDRLGHVVPMGFLVSAEIGPIEELLQADDLAALARGFLDQPEVLSIIACLMVSIGAVPSWVTVA